MASKQLLVKGECGRGDSGAVLKATLEGRLYALKVPLGSKDTSGIKTLWEVDILSKTRHPNLLGLVDVCWYEGNFCLLLPYYSQQLSTFRLRDLDAFKVILHDIAMGCRELFRLRIVHIDLKEPNILISKEGRAVIGDMGGACYLETIKLVLKTINFAGILPSELHPTKIVKQASLDQPPEILARVSTFFLGLTIQRVANKANLTLDKDLIDLCDRLTEPNAQLRLGPADVVDMPVFSGIEPVTPPDSSPSLETKNFEVTIQRGRVAPVVPLIKRFIRQADRAVTLFRFVDLWYRVRAIEYFETYSDEELGLVIIWMISKALSFTDYTLNDVRRALPIRSEIKNDALLGLEEDIVTKLDFPLFKDGPFDAIKSRTQCLRLAHIVTLTDYQLLTPETTLDMVGDWDASNGSKDLTYREISEHLESDAAKSLESLSFKD